jgi:hypothetical protein
VDWAKLERASVERGVEKEDKIPARKTDVWGTLVVAKRVAGW